MNNVNEKKFPVIETDRLLLRDLKTSDNKSIFDIFSSEIIMKYYGMNPIKSTDEAEKLINNLNKSYNENKVIRWGIVLKEENILIGTCGFHSWNKSNSRVEIGYELSRNYWNKGYATEVISSIIDYGFNELNLHRIQALVNPENKTSHHLLLKLGFEKEGTLKDYGYLNEKYYDLIMYSLIKD